MNTKQRLFKPAEPAEHVNGELVQLHLRQEYAEVHEELKALEALHAEREKAKQKLMARNRGERTKRSPAERAADLLAGGRVDPTPIPDALAAINEELSVLRGAICEKTRALDAISDRISYEESLKEKSGFDADVVEAYQHLEVAVAAFQRAEGRANRLRAAGYRPSYITFRDVEPYGVKLLRMNGLEQFKRDLITRGAL